MDPAEPGVTSMASTSSFFSMFKDATTAPQRQPDVVQLPPPELEPDPQMSITDTTKQLGRMTKSCGFAAKKSFCVSNWPTRAMNAISSPEPTKRLARSVPSAPTQRAFWRQRVATGRNCIKQSSPCARGQPILRPTQQRRRLLIILMISMT